MRQEQAFELVRRANPVVKDVTGRGAFLSKAALLERIDERSGDMQTQDKQIIEKPKSPKPNRKLRAAVAAFSVAVIAAIVIAALIGGGEKDDVVDVPPTTTPVTTQPPTTTTVPPFTVDEASAVKDAYFEAYNAGDVEAVLALFEPDATFFNDPLGWQTRADWEQLLVWNAAQGTTLSPPECTVTAEVSGVAVTVSCPHSNLDALIQAVDGPPVPINLTLTVTPDGIRGWVSSFGQPDFTTVGIPFEGWMQRNHPEDVSAVAFGNWSSVEEAEQNGVLTAQYADESAAFLEGNGCIYRDDC